MQLLNKERNSFKHKNITRYQSALSLKNSDFQTINIYLKSLIKMPFSIVFLYHL